MGSYAIWDEEKYATMRVLHLTTEFPPVIYGGLGTAIGGLVSASVRAGITVWVLLVGETGHGGYGQPSSQEHAVSDPEQGVDPPAGVTICQVSWLNAMEFAIHLVQTWRPDVVHLHPFWLWPVARAIQERTGTPLVYTVHSLDRAEYEMGQGPPECLPQWETQERVIAAADRVIALSRSERELLISYCPEARNRIRIVGNGIADDPAACSVVRKHRHNKPPLVLYSGRFVERKGIRDLLAAIPQILQEVSSTRFVLAGGHRHCRGAEMEHWWLPASLHPYRSHIHFTGWLAPHEVVEWYRAADVLVVPSWYEPFGMVILEGMLYGLPIVASAVGGPLEILEHGRTGLLFPQKDVEALAHALLQLVTNPDLRQHMGTAAADDVRRKWLWPHIVERIRVVYQEAMRAGSQRNRPASRLNPTLSSPAPGGRC